MSFQEYSAHMVRKGEAIGEARGEAKGAERERALSIQRERARMMAIAAGFLSADRLDQLRVIQDPDRLVAAFAQAMRESGR